MASRPHSLLLLALLITGAGAIAATLHAQEAVPQPADKAPPKPDAARRGAIMADDMEDDLRAAEPKIKERRDRINAELKTLDRTMLKDTDWAKEWAGTYYEGDGLGTNVSVCLAPKSGVAFLNYGCLGLYGADDGEVVEAFSDGLSFKLTFGDARNSFLSERIYFVRWGDEHFLVPAWLMAKLVNNYNEGGYARSEMFGIPRLVREGGHRRMVDAPKGRPELPPQFAKMLLAKPIDLKVLKVSTPTTRNVTGTVNARVCTIDFGGGSDQGAYVGMEFQYPKEMTLTTGFIRLTSVTPTTSTGDFTAFFGGDEKVRVPTVGESISTADSPPPVEPAPPKPEDANKPTK